MSKVKLIKNKEKQLFNVTINHLSGKVEEFTDIVGIEPASTGLLVLISASFKTVVRVIANLEGYDFISHITGGE